MKPDDLTQSMNTRPKADAAIKLLIRHVGYRWQELSIDPQCEKLVVATEPQFAAGSM